VEKSGSAPSSRSSSRLEAPKPSHAGLVIELLKTSATKATSDPQAKAVLVGLPLVMHDMLAHGDDDILFEAVKTQLEANREAKKGEALLEFLAAWCLSGRSMSGGLLERMQSLVLGQVDSTAKFQCLARISRAQDDFSPVLGRWRSNISPRTNLFVWLRWDPAQIGAALTCMCLPFFRLRANEFHEKNPGKHLKDLNLRYNSVSKFVALSVLSAAIVSKKQGVTAVEHWLDVAVNLRERHNYHMLFAIQNALEMHPVSRLSFLFKSASKKHTKAKKDIDQLFSATDRMKKLKAEVADLVGKAPLVPCVFWLVQKAALLQETPMLTADGKLNELRVLAATNIFVDLAPMQDKRYPPLREDEQMLWYLMRLEREELCSEEDLYKLSDAAKKLGSRFQIGGGIRKGKIADPAALEAAVSANQTAAAGSPKKRSISTSSGFKLRLSSNGNSEEKSSEDEQQEFSSSSEAVLSENPLSLEAIMQMADVHVTGKSDKDFLKTAGAFF
jgi:hypothetical protein